MKIMEFNERLWKLLRSKMIAVSGDNNFHTLHFPFRTDDDFDEKAPRLGKQVSIFCPFSQKKSDLNLWAYSGLSSADPKELFKNAPTRIEVPKDKMRTKYQSTFSMDNAGVFRFCLKMTGMVCKRAYTFEYVLDSIAKDLYVQFCERPLSPEEKDMETMVRRLRISSEDKEEKLEDLKRARFLKFLSGVDAMEIVRTTKEYPHILTDEGAECVETKTGYPVIVPNKHGVIHREVKQEGLYEGYAVVMYRFKNKETRDAVERRKNIITRNAKEVQEPQLQK